MSTHTVREGLPSGLIVAAAGVGVLVGYTAAVDPVVRTPAQVAYPLVWVLASGAALKRYVVPAIASSSLPAVAVGGGRTNGGSAERPRVAGHGGVGGRRRVAGRAGAGGGRCVGGRIRGGAIGGRGAGRVGRRGWG